MSHVNSRIGPGTPVRAKVFAHRGMWILFRRELPVAVFVRFKGWRVHRFDEGVTWWRPGVELRARQVAEALR
jgi:SH3-like domain-containing protein